ncbi:MAG: hypothetical protein ACXWNK_10255 [Vulcanimicrobiaceae bacterium]
MRIITVAATLVLSAALGACSKAPAPEPASSAPRLMIEDRGVTMRLEDAVRNIGFRAFVPSAQPAAIAVIPPLGGADTRENRGIAFEYDAGGDALLLSQWPEQRFQIAVGHDDLTQLICAPVPFKADGFIWTTHSALVMTLQPDGKVASARVAKEARRLIASGACR